MYAVTQHEEFQLSTVLREVSRPSLTSDQSTLPCHGMPTVDEAAAIVNRMELLWIHMDQLLLLRHDRGRQ